MLPSINPTTTNAWKTLQTHFQAIKHTHLRELFAQNVDRKKMFSVQFNDINFNYSKNRITQETINYLIELANQCQLKNAIEAYFSGKKINKTEDRAVLHTALRANENTKINVNGVDIIAEIKAVKQQIKQFTNTVLNGTHKGATGKTITNVVNIGIGGSDLGPMMITEALKHYKTHLNIHFVNNVDGDHVQEVIKNLDPETTLFIIVSKSFTTQETLTNAQTIKQWFLNHANLNEAAIAKHFVAVSTNLKAVKDFGINEANIFPMWNWVGGRFSLWSAVGLSISLAIGYTNFEALLNGAQEADNHFKAEDFSANIPVLMALLGVWYANFFNTETKAVIPYSQYLKYLPSYLQQASMESNGKNVDRNGDPVTYQTASIIWGEPGTNSQHSFFQLLHQGTKLIPSDFIVFKESLYGNKDHQQKLMANFNAQTQGLAFGKTLKEAKNEQNDSNTVYRVFKGNRPTNVITINKLTPKSLGKLIALYEHNIFVQGVIWNIYSYDQFGVELGKQIASKILANS